MSQPTIVPGTSKSMAGTKNKTKIKYVPVGGISTSADLENVVS